LTLEGGVEALDTAEGGGRGHHTAVPIFGIEYNENGKECEISNCLTTRYSASQATKRPGNGAAICIPVLTPDRAEKRQNGRRFKDNGDEAFTLTAQDIHGVALQADKSVTIPVIWYEKYKCYIAIRKLTPRECFRLQGWTDDYFDKAQFVNSDSQLYKQAGNAITVTVMEDIAKALKEVENGQEKHTDREGQTENL
jgi:DNA (cytosine-5)-methyltransferase 1